MRLEDIFGTDEYLGSKNILFVGDLIQLPPVNGRPVFKKISNKLVKTKLGVANAVNIWKETVEYDELTINERQKGDETFFKMLDSVRHGCLTDETLDMLKSHVFKFQYKKNIRTWKVKEQILQFAYFLRLYRLMNGLDEFSFTDRFSWYL
uniref:ATP-dependent DNA helicase n=1 Tax=Amphimedon queenslandica TaxID=400682 RepID=A0A1X7V9D7_AMPQE